MAGRSCREVTSVLRDGCSQPRTSPTQCLPGAGHQSPPSGAAAALSVGRRPWSPALKQNTAFHSVLIKSFRAPLLDFCYRKGKQGSQPQSSRREGLAGLQLSKPAILGLFI